MSDAHKAPENGRAGEVMEQIHSHLEYDANEKKERLRDDLADFLFQSDEESFDNERFEALLDALDAADPLADLPDTQESLKAFHEKYAPLAAPAEAASADNTTVTFPEKRRSRRPLFRGLSIAAILILLLGSMSAQAFGFDLFGTLARWTAEIFHIGSDEVPHAEITLRPLAEGESATYDSLQEAVDAFGITEKVVPTRIPERFTLMQVTAFNRKGKVLINADYVSGEEYFQITYNEIRTNESVVEKEDKPAEIYRCGKLQHYLVSDLGWAKAFWQNGSLECYMAGNISEQEMMNIIDSVYEEKEK